MTKRHGMEQVLDTYEKPVYPRSMFLGFDFFGAGNIGDDLTLAGFLDAVALLQPRLASQLCAVTQWNLKSQRHRFPNIRWISSAASHEVEQNGHTDCWAGIGDTPFQLTSGTWCLEFLQEVQHNLSSFEQKILVNVGAEKEILSRVSDFAIIAKSFDRISTRDDQSAKLISGALGVPSCRVFSSADLANISLACLLESRHTTGEFPLGMIIAGDTLSRSDISEVRRFAKRQNSPVTFIACETRPGPTFERGVFQTITRRSWMRAGPRGVLHVPSYDDASLADLIAPICRCTTVLSSRYHGLLTAGWAGCRIGAIGRSSKVEALAESLRVPCCSLPLCRDKLECLADSAVEVPRNILNQLKERAIQGVAFAVGRN